MRKGAEGVQLSSLDQVPWDLLQRQVMTPWETVLQIPFSHPHNCDGMALPATTKGQVMRVAGKMPAGFDPPTVRDHLNSKGKAIYDEAMEWLKRKMLTGEGSDRIYALGADCYLPSQRVFACWL